MFVAFLLHMAVMIRRTELAVKALDIHRRSSIDKSEHLGYFSWFAVLGYLPVEGVRSDNLK